MTKEFVSSLKTTATMLSELIFYSTTVCIPRQKKKCNFTYKAYFIEIHKHAMQDRLPHLTGKMSAVHIPLQFVTYGIQFSHKNYILTVQGFKAGTE
jgi:hypothetical protein